MVLFIMTRHNRLGGISVAE